MTSFDLTLYLVTDRRMPKEGFETVVEEAIRGGVTLVQLREKEGDTGLLYERARRLKEVTDCYHIPLIIDDRIDIMLAVDAAGVHVGQSDMPAAIARQMIGPDKILGVSAANLTEALMAEADGADYLGVGAMYPTKTKTDADFTTRETLEVIKRSVHIPVCAIGGINEKTIPDFKGSAIDGFAIVSAIMASEEPKTAAEKLKRMISAAAQLGIFATFIGARALGLLNFPELAFTNQEAASIAIIGGADGPTAIYLTSKLAPHLLGAIAVAAYSYMALVPIIQPPIMRALTTKKERSVVMTQLRPVSKLEKILFPIFVTVICVLLLPSAAPLIGMLMLGNLFRESGVVERISKTAQNELMNIITILLGVTVGATANAATFLQPKTLLIIVLGLLAFCFGTAGGVLFGKLMYVLTKGKVNPLIGSAGVSAVPMAARVAQKVGQQENPSNFLLMHAMGPNVAGVIGSAVAAGILINIFG